MKSSLMKIFDIIIAIIIMFIIPILYFGQKQDTISQIINDKSTSGFVDTVATNGFISKDLYEGYTSNLDNTGNVYTIELEQKELILEPEYRFKKVDEIIDEQNDGWGGENPYNYVPVNTDIPTVSDPINNGGLNTETNESILASAVNGSANASHVHTNSCYVGHRHDSSCYTVHNHSGSSTYGGGCYGGINYNYHSHSSSCYHRHSSTAGSCYTLQTCGGSAVYSHSGSGNYGSTTCPECGVSVDDGYVQYYKCSTCGSSMGGIYHNLTTYHCGKKLRNGSGTTNNVKSSCTAKTSVLTCTISTTDPLCGKTTSTTEGISSYYINCGKSSGTSYLTCYRTVDSTADCSLLVHSVSPTHSVQTVYMGDSLITTVTVTYLNGSTKVVVCSANFVPNTIVSNRTVTLSYSNAVEGVAYGPFTSTITVTVIPKVKTCIRGHTYNLRSDGTDPGCPYCRAWLASLVVHSPSGPINIYRGTTLVDNAVILLATYMDGRTEYVTTGYVDNLDKYYVGQQNVTLSYKGKYVSLMVTVKRNIIRCDICGNYYELYPDDTNPGCPYCASLIPVFTGNVMEYYQIKVTDEILNELYYGSGKYYLEQGDFLSVKVNNKSSSPAMNMLESLYGNKATHQLKSSYGTKIRDTRRE